MCCSASVQVPQGRPVHLYHPAIPASVLGILLLRCSFEMTLFHYHVFKNPVLLLSITFPLVLCGPQEVTNNACYPPHSFSKAFHTHHLLWAP